ncbi:TetR/AcrR family transcriptional regulator [Novosphingobium sp. Chol11]|uniref:TetR/AcrR family transcriptional regulator n=1 Tax=Novosphingobium sp. Chol11 TaxID=1385763 RepID=UPI00114196E7|nr:TetR/AcrR family transcriptional regulator [Novosphingobium sp. Chol11]
MKQDSEGSSNGAKTRRVGRPRRLSIDQVLDAGLALGLDGLTMGAVADRLGVTITVLYGYVANREELVRLAAARAAQQHDFPGDCGQHWTLYAASHAVTLFELLTGPGQLVSQYLTGGMGPEVELDRAEAWLEGMTKRGFHPREALLLQRQMGEIVIGGAVSVWHLRSFEAAGTDFGKAAARAFAARDETALPLLRSEQASFSDRRPVWAHTFAQLLESVALNRGEEFDRQAVMHALAQDPPG